MATWGEFMQAFKITNMKGTVYIHADQVLEVWEERNQLREDIGELREQLAEERDRCARDIEEFAEACAAEPDQPEFIVKVLQMAAQLIRDRGEVPVAEEVDTSTAESIIGARIPPAEEVPATEEVSSGEEIPTAEALPGEGFADLGDIPTAEPLPGDDNLS